MLGFVFFHVIITVVKLLKSKNNFMLEKIMIWVGFIIMFYILLTKLKLELRCCTQALDSRIMTVFKSNVRSDFVIHLKVSTYQGNFVNILMDTKIY